MFRRPPTRAALSLAAAVVLLPLTAQAQTAPSPAGAGASAERESLEALRQTTLALIDALVQSGTLSRDKADALLADARRRAQAVPAGTAAPAWGDAPRAAAAAAAADVAPVVRVPYVPQLVRDQIRNELREEIVARARMERWGVPNATAEWTDRIAIEGDLRVRGQGDRQDAGNTTPEVFLSRSLSGTTRAPDLAAGNSVGLATANTLEDRDRLRLRARLAVNAKVADNVTAGLRLATGSAADRVSTHQTLGQNFNRYAFLLDRAFIKFDAAEWASLSAGRIANPWFATDLVWSENLNFEGVAGSFKWPVAANADWQPFATLGYFPVRESAPPKRGRSISGVQVGVQWEASARTRLKLGAAQYLYSGFSGRVDPDYDIVSGAGRSYGQYEYEAGLRQRGNSLFLTNNAYELAAGLTPDKARWGLGMNFRPLVFTAAAEFSHFAPTVVGLSGEVVVNRAFNLYEAYSRSGVWFNDARRVGAGLRATVGAQSVRNTGDWQVSVGYRWLGSDAVPDAFVDSDLGGGGTNIQGYSLGLQYGLARDTGLGVRWLSARTLSSPTVVYGSTDKYGLSILQVDLNVRF
ncbi:putative porin [Aquabacterium sp. OR-4]|uniref:putative porin n=1 Tax=Aquabacterium sp. OR-4 TaxID=2978127 RepID=UPI0021B42082|nr:putative porin [Aquabacterium sp. OR-4]MDT7838938.1 putative porin [Aquabacterium sp. OR-4]